MLAESFVGIGEESSIVIAEHHDSKELPEADRVGEVPRRLDLIFLAGVVPYI